MGPTILLADDERHITHVVARKLQNAGFEVFTADDGEEALSLVPEVEPDLIVTDLQMPYMSGIELAQALHEDPATSDIPLIMLTARGYVLEPDELAKTNIRFLMSKPFSAAEILDKVRQILPERGATREAA